MQEEVKRINTNINTQDTMTVVQTRFMYPSKKEMSDANVTRNVVHDIGLAFDEVNKFQDSLDNDYFNH